MRIVLHATMLATLLSCTLVAAVSPARGQTLEELDRRIKAIEKKSARLSAPAESARSMKSFLNTNLSFGGFFETTLQSLSKSNQSTQAASQNSLGFNVSGDFEDNLHFATQFITYLSLPVQNQNSDPRGASIGLPNQAEFGNYLYGALLTQAYVDWASSEEFSVQMGLGYAPYGIALQQLEPVLFVRRGGPQLLRTSDLVFPFWQGVHLHGSKRVDESRVGYDAYTFSGSGNTKYPGGGARLWWKSPAEAWNFGISSQVSKHDLLTSLNLGADFRFHLGYFTITHEISKSSGEGEQPWSAYVETDYELYEQTWIVFLFGDYLDNPYNLTRGLTGTLADPFRKWEYGAGVNWLPTSFTRFRLAFVLNSYVGPNAQPLNQSRDYWNIDLSAGVAF